MSQSATSWNGDIGTRYERLATEYQKLRAQATVLKKGVLEERAKNDKVTEELKVAENTNRRLKNENESLSFRNEQLVKRMQSVQEELDERSKGGKMKGKEGKKGKTTQKEKQLETALAVLEEELKNKLEQNERLTTKVTESEKLTETLSMELKELKERLQEVVGGRDKERNGTMSCTSTSHLKSDPLTLLSPSPSSLSSTAAPCESPLWQVADSSRGIITGLSTLLSLLEQRLQLYPYDATLERLPPHIQKLSSSLNESSRLFTVALEAANRVFDQPSDQWQKLSLSVCDSLQSACTLATQSLPSQLERLSQDESGCAWSDGALEALNERWRMSLCSLLSETSSLIPSLRCSLEMDDDSLTSLSQSALSLHSAAKATQEAFSARWLVETRLPVQTKKGKCVGTATRDCLLKMVGEANKGSSRLAVLVEEKRREEKELERRREEEERERMRETIMNEERIRQEEQENNNALDEESSCEVSRKTSAVSVRVEEKMKRRGEDARIHCEMDTLRTKIRELEGERERLILDVALLRRKAAGMVTVDKMDETVNSSQVETHYKRRMRETAERLLRAEARGDYYSRECELLVRSSRCVHGEKSRLEGELEGEKEKKKRIEDELKMTRNGYEAQLRELTEHITQLNTQREQMEKTTVPQKNTLTRRLTLFK